MGQHMNKTGVRSETTGNGYITKTSRYRAVRCEECHLCCLCFKGKGDRIIEVNHVLNELRRKARERLTSEEGLRHRGKRCIKPEAVFGQMKYIQLLLSGKNLFDK